MRYSSIASSLFFAASLSNSVFAAEKTGLLHDSQWPYREGVEFYQPVIDASELPDSFDLRDYMLNGVPTIKRQNCGDCWAWSTHHALEIARAVHDQVVVDHSVQAVLSCSKTGTCNGGYMSTPNFLVGRGLPTESEFKYAGRDRACPFSAQELKTGWDGKVFAAPYVGSSMQYSRAAWTAGTPVVDGSKVQAMMAAMYQYRAPLVVTVKSYSAGKTVVESCSSINSGGNHMVAIVGWSTVNGKRVAHVWNSHGTSHGDNGVSRIVWECGSGKLNRGLGVSARVLQYKDTSSNIGCDLPIMNLPTNKFAIKSGETATIGAPMYLNQKCKWTPTEGLSDPNACVTQATPTRTTEYHLQAANTCGNTSAMVLVEVTGATTKTSSKRSVLTPTGVTTY